MTPLTLDPITVDGSSPITLEPRERPYVLGRSSQCEVVMPDPAGVVSRRHCELRTYRERWQIRDLGSRHGTLVNGIALVKDEWTALEGGMALKIGASVFRVRIGAALLATMIRTMDDRGSPSVNIRKVSGPAEHSESARRLELLMRAAATIGSAASSEEIAKLAAERMIEAAPYSRVSVLRPADANRTDLEVMATLTRPGQHAPTGYSRSLIEAASEGQTVLLSGRNAGGFGESIVSLGIGSALCAPIIIDDVVDAYLYADTRAELGDAITAEVAAVCQTLAAVCGLAFADRYRRTLDVERKRRDEELKAAREVQSIIMPPETGGIDGLSYAMRCVPGRFVAGDMFDFVRIDDHRAAIYLGDVVGKGIAAGMIMANVQGHLSRLLGSGAEVGEAITEASAVVSRYSDRFVEERGGSAIFLSLFAAVFDAKHQTIRFTDAGHGLWLVRHSDGTVDQPALGGGVPVGLLPETVYASESLELKPGERFIVFSDGVKEQRSAENEEFGAGRMAEALFRSASPSQDAASVVSALARFVGVPTLTPGQSPFADDVTVASVEFA